MTAGIGTSRSTDQLAAALAAELRELRRRSGKSLRELERATYSSDSSLSRYLSGQTLPPWQVVESLCQLGGGDAEALRVLWTHAREARSESRAARAAMPPAPAEPELTEPISTEPASAELVSAGGFLVTPIEVEQTTSIDAEIELAPADLDAAVPAPVTVLNTGATQQVDVPWAPMREPGSWPRINPRRLTAILVTVLVAATGVVVASCRYSTGKSGFLASPGHAPSTAVTTSRPTQGTHSSPVPSATSGTPSSAPGGNPVAPTDGPRIGGSGSGTPANPNGAVCVDGACHNVVAPVSGNRVNALHEVYDDAAGWHYSDTGQSAQSLSAVNMGGSHPQVMTIEDGVLHQIYTDSSGWHDTSTGIYATAVSAVNMGGQSPKAMILDTDDRLLEVSADGTGWRTADTGQKVARFSAVNMGGSHPQVMALDTDDRLLQIYADSAGWHSGDTKVRTHDNISAVNMGGIWPQVMTAGTNGHLWQIYGDSTGWHYVDTGLPSGSQVSAVNMGGVWPQVMTPGNDGHLWRLYGDSTGWHADDTGVLVKNPVSAVNMGGAKPRTMTID